MSDKIPGNNKPNKQDIDSHGKSSEQKNPSLNKSLLMRLATLAVTLVPTVLPANIANAFSPNNDEQTQKIEEYVNDTQYNIVDQNSTIKAEKYYEEFAKRLNFKSVESVIFYNGGWDKNREDMIAFGSAVKIDLPSGIKGYITAVHNAGNMYDFKKYKNPIVLKLGDLMQDKQIVGNTFSKQGNNTRILSNSKVFGEANTNLNIIEGIKAGMNSQDAVRNFSKIILNPNFVVVLMQNDIAIIAKNNHELKEILTHLDKLSNLATISQIVEKTQKFNSAEVFGKRINPTDNPFHRVYLNSNGMGASNIAVPLGKTSIIQKFGANNFFGETNFTAVTDNVFLTLGYNNSIQGKKGEVIRRGGRILRDGNSGQVNFYTTNFETNILGVHHGQVNLQNKTIPEIINYLEQNPVFTEKVWETLLLEKIIKLDKNIMNYLEHATPDEVREYQKTKIAIEIKAGNATVYMQRVLSKEIVQDTLKILNSQEPKRAPEIGIPKSNQTGAVK